MSIVKPRNRLVNFRLNEEEYESLKAAYSLRGARSLSDFARSVVMRSVGLEEWAERMTHERLFALGRKVSELESHLRDLQYLVKGSEGGKRVGRS